jgi:hypothetical protein
MPTGGEVSGTWILLFQESTAECIARDLTVTRVSSADLSITLLDGP